MRLAREPLVHFLVLGLGLFGLYGLVGDAPAENTDARIVVTDADLDWLRQNFVRQWNRPPRTSELEHLVDGHVREEVYFREALALGLDGDDTIIRRRLVQKLEFLSEDLVVRAEPADDALRQFFAERAETYRVPPRLTFSHIYFSPDQRANRARRDAEEALADLQARSTPLTDALERGDRFMLEHTYPLATTTEVEREFGRDFAERAATLEVGRWSEPIESAYGFHLVYLEAREPGRLPTLDEVRDEVRRDFDTARRVEMNEAFYASLRARYTVEIAAEPEPRTAVAISSAPPLSVAPQTDR